MDARQTIKKAVEFKGSVAAAVFVVTIAALFVMMPMNPAVAADTMSIKGSVASVDSYHKTFSVLGPEGNKITMNADSSTSVTLCARNKGFENLAAGQRVAVKYHMREGGLVADAIDIYPLLLACYNQ